MRNSVFFLTVLASVTTLILIAAGIFLYGDASGEGGGEGGVPTYAYEFTPTVEELVHVEMLLTPQESRNNTVGVVDIKVFPNPVFLTEMGKPERVSLLLLSENRPLSHYNLPLKRSGDGTFYRYGPSKVELPDPGKRWVWEIAFPEGKSLYLGWLQEQGFSDMDDLGYIKTKRDFYEAYSKIASDPQVKEFLETTVKQIDQDLAQ